ncbi:MAG: glycosyltransferase family 4 protein [Opitutales bacterium]
MAEPLPLLIIDSHPIQYKAPVYRRLGESYPGQVFVLYGCDASVRGQLADPGFGQTLAWGAQLLEGYPHAFLKAGEEVSLGRFNALKGEGVARWIRKRKPQNVLLSQCNYQMDFRAILAAKRSGAKLWIRHETQDEAFSRGPLKTCLRALYYRFLYKVIDGAFACGKANRRHLRKHGMAAERIGHAPYCVPDRIRAMSRAKKEACRASLRTKWKVSPETKVLLFSGKFIPKKNPTLIAEALKLFSAKEKQDWLVVFVGSGPLAGDLKAMCQQHGIRAEFTGFVDQADLPAHYLAADIMVLPSRRMGETWGLVVNEALQAGCAVAVSDAVGSHEEFGAWERVALFGNEDTAGLKEALGQLARYRRDFDWARPGIEAYSVDAAAAGIAERIFPD